MIRHMNKNNKVELMFELYEQKMYRVAFSILHNEWQAEDAVMDAFEKILKHEDVTDEPYSDDTKRYVIQVIKNAAIDIYRKNVREREHITFVEDESGQIFHQDDDFDCAFSNKVADIIKGLPKEYRDVLYERYAKEKTVQETAQTLHISECAVRKRQERALKMLRDRIGGSHYEIC